MQSDMRVLSVKKQQNAKYAVGSSVYLVYNINGEYRVHEDIMEVGRVSKDDEGYHYSLRNRYDDHLDWCYEEDVFGTRASAKEEAVRRNSLSEDLI